PAGAETVDRIAVHEGRVRFPDERSIWRLLDVGARTITVVDEVNRTVTSRSFDEALEKIRKTARKATDLPVAEVAEKDEIESFAGFPAKRYDVTVGSGFEREMFVSERPLIHSDLFLLRLATDPISDENLPALRELIELFDDLDGYPVAERSRMIFDGVEYTITRQLIAVSDQSVPSSWFEIPEWTDGELTAPPADRRSGESLRPDRNAPAEESPPSG
ncbi:MAG: hypothetical protein R3338_04725, partial [Thermoanaerobaculia bacterium]|nr:hypothetical protein [Thermoanaerobaculia bacterium]